MPINLTSNWVQDVRWQAFIHMLIAAGFVPPVPLDATLGGAAENNRPLAGGLTASSLTRRDAWWFVCRLSRTRASLSLSISARPEAGSV
jgi:hypothetical protein